MRPGETSSRIVEDFLNVAGIVGVALMNGPQLDYFCHLNGTLQAEDKALFAQNVSQVFETVPTEFAEVELQLQTHWTHLYRLDRSRIFVVWLGNAADREHYGRLLPTLLGLLKDAPGRVLDQFAAHTIGATSQPATVASVESPLEAGVPMLPSLQDMLQVMNRVIDAGVEFLGRRILTNQVMMARPDDPWLSAIALDGQGMLVAPGDQLLEPLTPVQYASLKIWVDEIILAVRRVIRNFREILMQDLSPIDQALLFEELQ